MAKFMISYDNTEYPPLLRMNIRGCPHKRQHRAVLQRFREEMLMSANRQIGHLVDLPIDHPIDLELFLVNPASPDLDHLLEAIFMALDGKSLSGPSLLTDDRLISGIRKMSKYYDTPAVRADTER